MRFDGFAGNEQAKRQASAFADAGHFPHALLIEGPIGSGRKTFATRIAQAAVCTGEGAKPCGVCGACRKVENGIHPDVELVGGAGGARSFHIDTVRELCKRAVMMPNEAHRRVLILADVQTMTDQAQNALLKILEEPPAHLLFILTCENRAQLLATIRSRVMCLTLSPVEEEEGVAALCRQDPSVSADEWRSAVRVFGGVLGQAIQGVHDGGFRQVQEMTAALGTAVMAADELELLKATARLEKNKELVDGVLGGLLLIFRDALCMRVGGTAMVSTAPDVAQTLSKALTKRHLMELVAQTQALQRMRSTNMNYTLFLTQLCARLRKAAGK